MTGKVLHLKLLRLVSLFKSESEAKALENVRFSQYDIRLLITGDKFQITRIFLIPVDEMMTSIFRKGLTFKTN